MFSIQSSGRNKHCKKGLGLYTAVYNIFTIYS